MSPDLQAAADLLLAARREHRRIILPATLRPRDFASAYALQAAVERGLGLEPVAWKVGAPDARSTPSAAPIYDLLPSPARIASAGLHMIGVEAEVAAVFTSALPPRDAPYSDEEAMAAVQELRVVIEVCDSRLADWQTADDATRLADHQLNVALVVGDAVQRPHEIDFGRLGVRTWVDGKVLKEGAGTHAVGNPLRLLPWLANHVRSRGGLRAGTIATLGAWLGLHIVQPGADVVVEFPTLGKASVTFPAQ
jgi:2-keto-4-pentenoate hydratase